MNIVFHRYNSICEPGYIEAFRALGIDVIEEDAEIRNKSISGEDRIESIARSILENKPMFVFSINFFPYISDICEKLNVLYVCVSVDCPVAELYSVSIRNKHNRVFLFDQKQYEDIAYENPGNIFHLPLSAYNTEKVTTDFKYDVTFIGSLYTEKNPFPEVISKVNSRVKGACDGLLSAQELFGGLELIDQIMDARTPSVLPSAPHSTGQTNMMTNAPQAASDGIAHDIKQAFAPFLPPEISTPSDFIYDMAGIWAVDSCLGYELTVRDRLLLIASLSESLADVGASMHLFTRSDVSGLKSLTDKTVIHGGVNTLTEMPDIFGSSKININTTMRAIRTGLPQRIWDIMGVGGFVLTDYRTEIPEYLTIGKHLEAYESIDEACEKAAYFLAHEDERLEIAENGYKEVCKKHTILNRVTSMISMIMNEA